MTYNLGYWLFAYVLTTVALSIAARGYFHIRQGNIAKHRKMMVTACNLILFFAVTYVFKALILGREDKSAWSGFYLTVLYIHETFIAGMLLGGGYARYLAYRFKDSLFADSLSQRDQSLRRRHASAGKVTLILASLALVTAVIVLYGMFARA